MKHCPSCVEATESSTRFLPKGKEHAEHPCDITDRPHGNLPDSTYQSGRHCVTVEDNARYEASVASAKAPTRHQVRDTLHTIATTSDEESRDLLSDQMPRTK